ncbi:MAG: hypothetical protein ACF8PN_12830 [Phycisphaerales bacterium]
MGTTIRVTLITMTMLGVVMTTIGCRNGQQRRYRIAGEGVMAKYDAKRDRIVHFGAPNKPRKNILDTNDLTKDPDPAGSYHFFGGTYTWIAPQSDWVDEHGEARDWPPDPAMDRGPTYVRRLSFTGLEAEGPVDRRGLRQIKTLEIRPGKQMDFTYEIVNDGEETRRAAPWVISAAPARAIIAVPKPRFSSIRFNHDEAAEMWDEVVEDAGDWLLLPTERFYWWTGGRNDFKAFIPSEPVIAIWRQNWWLLRVGEEFDDAGSLWEAGEAPVEVYFNYGLELFEAELLGPIAELGPGESTVWNERWFLIHSNSPDTGVLDEALAEWRRRQNRHDEEMDDLGGDADTDADDDRPPTFLELTEDKDDGVEGGMSDEPLLEVDEPADEPDTIPAFPILEPDEPEDEPITPIQPVKDPPRRR